MNMTGEAVLGRKVDDKHEVCIPDKQTERGYPSQRGSQQREGTHIPPPDPFFIWCPLSQNDDPPATHMPREKVGRGHLRYFLDTFLLFSPISDRSLSPAGSTPEMFPNRPHHGLHCFLGDSGHFSAGLCLCLFTTFHLSVHSLSLAEGTRLKITHEVWFYLA